MNRPTTPEFPGFALPGTDFAAVRDGRRAVPFYLPVDLSIARSIAAGTQLVVPLAGNSFYSDPVVDATGLPVGGVAVVHFQDANLNPAGTPFTVAPQFIARVPFTQLLIENPAQPGKRAVFIYGVDVDFTPGINAQVSISGAVGVRSLGQNYGAKFSSSASIGIAGTEQVFAAAANLNGAIVHRAQVANLYASLVGGLVSCGLHAHTVAPAAVTDGDLILIDSDMMHNGSASGSATGKIEMPLLVPAGRGIWSFNSVGIAQNGGRRSVLYTIL